MKQFILLLTFVSFRAIAQDTTFTKIFHRMQDNMGITTTASCKTASGNYYISGDETNGRTAFLQKLDSVGNELWVRRYKQAAAQVSDFHIQKITETQDSNLLIVGRIHNALQGMFNPFIAKLDQNGDTLWTKSMSAVGSSNGCNKVSFAEGANNEYYLVWSEFDLTDIFVAKYSASGVLMFNNKYPVVNNYSITGAAFDTLSNSLFVVASDYSSPYSGGAFAFDDQGNYQWGKFIDNLLFGNCAFYNGNLDISTRFPGNSGIGLTRVSSSGVLDWVYKYQTASWGTLIDAELNLEPTSDNGALLYEGADPSMISVVCKVDSSGFPERVGEAFMMVSRVHQTREGGYLLLGNGPMYGIKSNSTPHYGLVKTDSVMNSIDCFWSNVSNSLTVENPSIANWNTTISGSSIVGNNKIFYDTLTFFSEPGCVRFLGAVPSTPELVFEVYPNPVHDRIQFLTTLEGTYEIELLDISGKTVKNEHFTGKEIEVKLSSLEGGVYLYRIKSKDQRVASGRFIKH